MYVVIIMDGNGRWARARGMRPRVGAEFGRRQCRFGGLEAVARTAVVGS